MSASAKEKKPVNGSWQIAPIPLDAPKIIQVGSSDSLLLSQPLIPEAIRITSDAASLGKLSVDAGGTLFRVTTKQGTAWCALAPLRLLPEEKKGLGLANVFLGGSVLTNRQDTLCFADANNDGVMESAMKGSSKGYVLPVVDKLGKPVPIAPLATSEGDAASITDWKVELHATAALRKDKTDVIYSALLVGPGGTMSIDGFRLLEGEGNAFAIYGNLSTIDTKFDSVTAARITKGDADGKGNIELRVESAMRARSMTLGNPQPY
ncbi:hypothetical protein [Sphingorhabdus pulchriflava]|nr:hypothetical protein [Sphingorhabdus pulchriflava]